MDVSADGQFLIGHLGTYVKVLVAAEKETEESVIKAAMEELEKEKQRQTKKSGDENGEANEGSRSRDKKEEEEEEKEGKEEEGGEKTKLSSKSSLETHWNKNSRIGREKRGEEQGEAGEGGEESMEEGVGRGSGEGESGMFERLRKAGVLGEWMEVDVVAASRYYVLGVRSQ